ncbi:MAG: hypothetical protein QM831_08485 [Kofleriaceae bacterium]
MRAIALVLALCGVAAADPSAALPDDAVKNVLGCWRDRNEQWTFQHDGDHGVVVARAIKTGLDADRPHPPSTVQFDAKTGVYGFPTAGHIHSLMMVWTIKDHALHVTVFSSHDGKSWFATGSTMTMHRCN